MHESRPLRRLDVRHNGLDKGLADQLKQVDQQERKRQTKIAKLEGEITELERELSKSKGVDTSAAKKRRTALMRDKSKMVGQQRLLLSPREHGDPTACLLHVLIFLNPVIRPGAQF